MSETYDPNAEPLLTEKIESLRKKLQMAVDQQDYCEVIHIGKKLKESTEDPDVINQA